MNLQACAGKRKAWRPAVLGLLVLFAFPFLTAFQVPSNPGADFAFDATGTLSSETRQTIREVNVQMAGTGAQVVICMIPTLGDDSIEDTALDVFRT
ncbi:MAG: hypothetical protein GX838_00315, partial [Clostridiaceae bacterium]|nr:hypothetical protein [Clostridiaceae bacterium]